MKLGFASAPAALLPAILILCGASAAHSANIAGQGTGIIGSNTSINSTLGTPWWQAGAPTNINDGNLASRVDTYNGGQIHAGNPVSYVGILFAAPRADLVNSVSVNITAFFDGGWFGPNNSGPGELGTLTPTYLISPTVQITADGGANWITVASTDNYVSTLNGTVLPVAFGPPSAPASATFTLTAPVTAINGIRLIGSEGGTASGGFVGVFEMGVNANPIPEPSLVALTSLAGLMGLRRRRSR